MTRAGIITFHYGLNFGGVLQALALQQAMADLGTPAEIIDYVPKSYAIPKWWQGWNLRRGLKEVAIRNRLAQWKHEERARAKFDAFRSKHMERSKQVQDLAECQELFNQYELLVAGSDQIWHFDRSNCYFLSTTSGFTGRKISYASCSGVPARPKNYGPEVRGLLQSISKISVRNEFTAEMLQETTGERPVVVADPTLLVNQSNLQSLVKLPFKHFILCYFLGDEILGGHDEMIRQIRARVGNLPIVAVVAALNPQPTPYADHVLHDADPGQWLWLMERADFVYTDSYHGLLFALRNGLPALAYYGEGVRAPRMIDLAKRYALQNHVVSGVDAAASNPGWEFPASADSTERISQHVTHSRAYLRNARAQVDAD